MQPETNPGQNGRRPVFFRRREGLLVAALFLLALLGVWFFGHSGAGGASTGETLVAEVVITRDDGQIVRQISLETSGIVHVEDGSLPVQLEVEHGTIRFVHSVCPDHLCEGFGWISRQGESALCAPAGVLVRIVTV